MLDARDGSACLSTRHGASLHLKGPRLIRYNPLLVTIIFQLFTCNCKLLLLQISRYIGNNYNHSNNDKGQKNLHKTRKNFGGAVVSIYEKNCTILFRHRCESASVVLQVVPQAIRQVEQMQHSSKLSVMELSDFNLFPICLPICKLEFSRAVIHHFKYFLPD